MSKSGNKDTEVEKASHDTQSKKKGFKGIARRFRAAMGIIDKPVTQDSNQQAPSTEEINKIAMSVGKFSEYLGKDRKPIKYTPQQPNRQAYLAKQMLKQLEPSEGWEESSVTQLKKPLAKQKSTSVITIKAKDEDSKAAFGEGKVEISRGTLKSLSESARICTSQDLMPQQLFIEIQSKLRSKIKTQEQRNLKEILGSKYETWKADYQKLGFSSVEAFEKSASIPLNMLAVGVCHSQETHFFVEQENINGLAVNKLRNVNLDKATPNVLLSTPGINFKYGGDKAKQYLEDGTAKMLIQNMWHGVLSSAVEQNCQALSISAIGLGAFLPTEWDDAKKAQVAALYYDSLLEILAQPEYKGKFQSIYINPVFPFARAELDNAKKQHPDVASIVHNYDRDVKFLAVDLAKAGVRCALLNPSDPDVMWGKYDVGEYYKKGHYVGEEDLVATSTASLGSVGISDVYSNAAKVRSVSLPQVLKDKVKSAPQRPKTSPPIRQDLSSAKTPNVTVTVANTQSPSLTKPIPPPKPKKPSLVKNTQKVPQIEGLQNNLTHSIQSNTQQLPSVSNVSATPTQLAAPTAPPITDIYNKKTAEKKPLPPTPASKNPATNQSIDNELGTNKSTHKKL